MITGAVLGSPIKHSLSPLLHKSAFEFLGVEGTYSPIEVVSGDLATFFESNKDRFEYFSITMPLKEESLELSVFKDELVTKIQSANTLYRKDQDWHLTSTDGSGFIAALNSRNVGQRQKVLILGAGGTSRAIVGALDGIADEIVVLGRTSTRREALDSAVTHSIFEYRRWSDSIDFSEFDLVINTTPAGAADLLAQSVERNPRALLFDVIYNPWPTVLASHWSDAGGDVMNGLELLIYQGIQQLQLVVSDEIEVPALAIHLRGILSKAIK